MSLTKARLTFTSKLKTGAITVSDGGKKIFADEFGLTQLKTVNGAMSGSIFKAGNTIAGIDELETIKKKAGIDANYLYSDKEEDTLTFQFNPSTLRISAYGGGMTPIYNYAQEDGNDKNGHESNIIYGEVQTNITVDFKVIFDAETNTDAFMRDRYNASASNLAKEATQLLSGNSFLGDNNYIREIVEGFLSTLRNAEYRKVTFQWNNLKYSGDLNSVQCNYTMFNPKGEPIRAEVSVRILATGGDTGNGYAYEWRNRYNELIKAVDEKGASSLASSAFGASKAFNPINW